MERQTELLTNTNCHTILFINVVISDMITATTPHCDLHLSKQATPVISYYLLY